jgi:hypothetical protein
MPSKAPPAAPAAAPALDPAGVPPERRVGASGGGALPGRPASEATCGPLACPSSASHALCMSGVSVGPWGSGAVDRAPPVAWRAGGVGMAGAGGAVGRLGAPGWPASLRDG